MEEDIDKQIKQNSNISNTGSNIEVLNDLPDPTRSILQWINQNNNDIVTLADQNGTIKFISNSVERLLGYKAADLIGTMWYDKFAPYDVTYIKNYFDPNTNETQLFNVSIKNKKGKYIWFECTVAQVKAKNKVYLISILKDVTDKKEAEEMMIRSEKMSVAGQLAAGIAHEIRNPLTSLKGFLQLFQAGVNRKEEYYKIMIDEIEKMETITSELLFISKPLTDNRNKESVKDMLDDVISLLKSQAKLQNINLKLDKNISGFVLCDRSQIKQVLINLVKNAIEAMDDEGTIEMKVQSSHSKIIIDVIDEGPGIPEEVIHKLGEPFFTTKQNGTGLGLMITKQILDKHEGKLDILKNNDKGSTFRISLPTA
ncbi:ATP-binding protein [Virgibacillus byunsanensis]|uniref:histidine kinase n=1 Tax=Virgibacillus byunsanensis TaxID=570945 RepID=A0ABW3LLS0_9BACI